MSRPVPQRLDQHARDLAVTAWVCGSCGWIYDEEIGDPDGGVPPGTAFEDIPDDWVCPACGTRKSDFELMQL